MQSTAMFNPNIINRVCEEDILQHVEDTRLFTVWRGMHAHTLSWNEMTMQERYYELESQVHTAYCQEFSLYGY